MKYSVIIPVHNILKRGWQRLEWQLLSLELQTIKPQAVFIPDSSDAQNSQIVRQLAGRKWSFKCVYFHLDHPEGFNMPKLFNRAIERVETEWLFCTGVDFMYSPNLFEVYDEYKRADRFILKEVEMLPNRTITKKMVETFTFGRTRPNQFGRGADGIQFASTDFFVKIGGYDERMAGFGGMDNDMHNRAKKYGMETMWMAKNPGRILHIYHPSFKTNGDKQSKRNWEIRDNDKSIIRNFINK